MNFMLQTLSSSIELDSSFVQILCFRLIVFFRMYFILQTLSPIIELESSCAWILSFRLYRPSQNQSLLSYGSFPTDFIVHHRIRVFFRIDIILQTLSSIIKSESLFIQILSFRFQRSFYNQSLPSHGSYPSDFIVHHKIRVFLRMDLILQTLSSIIELEYSFVWFLSFRLNGPLQN